MELFSSNDSYKLYKGDMRNMLNVIQKESIDAVLTDPPYELNFMGKGWDNSGIAFQNETWKKCYDVLKPGGHLLAFGGSRTFHRIACAIEDAGFEIRDTIMWLYGSGFPKSMNIGLAIDKKNGIDNRTGNIVKGMGSNNTTAMKNCLSESQEFASEYEERIAQNEWQGWGTALKPSFEPIIVARKPFKGSLVDNVIEYGVGGINIDECRIETNDKNDDLFRNRIGGWKSEYVGGEKKNNIIFSNENKGRFPANTILTYDETALDEVCGGFPNTKCGELKPGHKRGVGTNNVYREFNEKDIGIIYKNYGGDSGSASRYFYCAKASKKDRDEGLDEFENVSGADITGRKEGSAGLVMDGGKQKPFAGKASPNNRNTHPTVKPTELMQYLVRLVSPNGATILDPFNGSGSTGKAVMYENKERNKNYKYIGIELTEEYLPIAKARIEYVCNLKEEQDNQTNIFDFIEE